MRKSSIVRLVAVTLLVAVWGMAAALAQSVKPQPAAPAAVKPAPAAIRSAVATTRPATAAPIGGAKAESGHPNVQTFLNTYCVECHGPKKQKGDRRFDQLVLPATTADALIDLQDIIDKMNLGEMPPKKSKQPGKEEMRGIIGALNHAVADAHSHVNTTGGQAVLRRLNRREYINTIGDLFSINMTMFDPTRKFPRDQTVAHMDNIGDALQTSSYLLEQYLDSAEQVIDKAFSAKERIREKSWTFNSNFHQQPELEYSHGRVLNFKVMNLYESRGSVSSEGAYGPIKDFAAGVPADGFYEIKVKCEALNRRHPYDPKMFGMDPAEPFRLGIVSGTEKVGLLYHTQPQEPELCPQQVVGDNGPEWKTFKVWLDAGYTPRFIFPNGMNDCRKMWTQIQSRYRNTFPESARDNRGIVEARANVLKYGKMPQIRIHEIQIRGPIGDTWPPAPEQAVFGGKSFDASHVRDVITNFATRAYRRPVRPDEVERLMAIYQMRVKDGNKPQEALKDTLKVVLCSPAFLYMTEPRSESAATEGKLSAFELASRLSYFLWSSTPDAELTRLAKSGDLLKPEVLTAQTRRLLSNPRSDEFVEGFLDSWLNLRSLGDMPPDRADFQVYYSQDLQNAMRKETQLFTRYLIDQNETIVRFLDSDYTFLNKSLARLYGMADAVPASEGGNFKKVKLSNPNRGGLLGQGSILTVSANGVETSPVTRGVWLLENILGTPTPPPPDNVPPIDPDVRGAKSMRDLLTKHRNNPTCYECHQKIDPLGFALEAFNPIGEWRSKYESGASIDTSGELPTGQSFRDVAGLKKILVDRKDQFAKTLTERLLTYGCGRRMEGLDRPTVTAIVEQSRKTNYGFRGLIEQIVLSDAFHSK